MSQSPDRNPALSALAWRICTDEKRAPALVDHSDERSALQAALGDGRLLEDDRGVRFADEHAMVLAATEHFLRTETDGLLASPRACFERLHDVFTREIGKQHRVSGCALAELHNAGRLDGFAWARQAIEAGVNVFDVLLVMEGAVPLFNAACAQEIYDFFAGHYEQVKNDLAGGIVSVKLPLWLAKLPDIARALKQMHEASPQERSTSLYACALQGLILHRFDEGFVFALEAAGNPTPTIIGPALHMLGLVDYANPPHLEALEHVIKLCTGIIRTPGHAQLGTATRALCRLLPAAEPRIVPLLEEAAKTGAPEALYALSEAMFYAQETLRDREWFWPLYLHLAAAKAEHKGILDNIDLVLMEWIRHPDRQDRALEFLNGWIAHQPLEVIRDGTPEKLFDATVNQLKKQPVLLNRAVTTWLLHDDKRYPIVAFHVISHLHEPVSKSLALDPAIIDTLQPNEIRFLVRRILGFIVGEDAQIGLIFSLVRTRDAKTRTLGLVIEVLRDHVGYDFPHRTMDYLKERHAAEVDENIRALCGEVITALEQDLAALDALPRLKELAPLSAKVHRFARERGKQMGRALDEVSKDSIWRRIASHVVLKAGSRTFQSIQGRYTEPMELKGISHSMALPRSAISDPAGADYKRYIFRTTTKDAQ
jgi:hypothetical protein